MAFTTTNTALQNSVAFLQIQKNSSLKRNTSMGEDVFRIFRQTGRRISLIKQQVERERCSYLKDSYTEKNQLYKELAGILRSKKDIHEKSRQLQHVGDSHSGSTLRMLSSQVSPAVDDTSGGNERHLSAHKALKEMRSINISVLKRCECCRRRAFRTIDNDDDDDGVFDEDAFHDQCESDNRDDKSPNKDKTRVTRKTSLATKPVQNKRANREKARLVQFSRYDDVRIPATQRLQAGIWALKKQTNVRKQTNRKKAVTFQMTNSTPSLSNEEEKAASATEINSASANPGLSGASARPTLKSRASIKLEYQTTKNSERVRLEGSAWTSHVAASTPGLSGASTRPTLKSRASIKLEYQTTKNNERVRLEGSDWTSHVENVQEKNLSNVNKVSGLSKAYCAFKKLLRQMEDEENIPEQSVSQSGEYRVDSRAEPLGSRPASNMSKGDSRWLPLRRSTDTPSVRLNTWTAGSLEPACMDSFKENGTEDQ